MREPKQLIEECKKHLRDTKQYKHEYKKDIRKLITALEKQLIIADVIVPKGTLCVCDKPSSYPKKDLKSFYCTKCGKDFKA